MAVDPLPPKEHILKQILSPDARLRLTNIKMVKPELANLVENYLIGMATQGKLSGSISDGMVLWKQSYHNQVLINSPSSE